MSTKEQLEPVRETIHAVAPGITATRVEELGEGDFCRGYLVDGEWVFRLAKKPEASRCLSVEIALEPALADTVELPVPRVEHSGLCPRTGEQVAGHRFLAGEPISPKRYRQLDPAVQQQTAEVLGRFLEQLHAYPGEAALRAGVQEADFPFCRTEHEIEQGSRAELFGRDLATVQAWPAEVLAAEARTQLEELLAGHLHSGASDRPPALVHGDLSGAHVLLPEGAEAPSAVIDFSDVLLCDPLLDLAYLYDAFGLEFLGRLLDAYSLPGDRERALVDCHFLNVWHVLMRLIWAHEHDWHEGVDYWRDRRLVPMLAQEPPTLFLL